jgi:hypothetical protein
VNAELLGDAINATQDAAASGSCFSRWRSEAYLWWRCAEAVPVRVDGYAHNNSAGHAAHIDRRDFNPVSRNADLDMQSYCGTSRKTAACAGDGGDLKGGGLARNHGL